MQHHANSPHRAVDFVRKAVRTGKHSSPIWQRAPEVAYSNAKGSFLGTNK